MLPRQRSESLLPRPQGAAAAGGSRRCSTLPSASGLVLGGAPARRDAPPRRIPPRAGCCARVPTAPATHAPAGAWAQAVRRRRDGLEREGGREERAGSHKKLSDGAWRGLGGGLEGRGDRGGTSASRRFQAPSQEHSPPWASRTRVEALRDAAPGRAQPARHPRGGGLGRRPPVRCRAGTGRAGR